MKVLVVFGTRPEAIKMAPVIKALVSCADAIKTIVCVTGQHREMLQSALEVFNIRPHYDLQLMQPGQTLPDLTCAILNGLQPVLAAELPDLVLVHGDTTTCLGASLASYYAHIPVAHVEAGLRSGKLYEPFPEEGNRRLTSAMASLHFAPTEAARANLLAAGVPGESIFVTGNTVVDALQAALQRIDKDLPLQQQLEAQFSYLDPDKRLILVTGHRRENFGAGFEHICHALADIADLFPDVELLYPVHLNPQVRQPVQAILGNLQGDANALRANVHLIDPVDYLPFVYLMRRAHLIITDSGGIQEEAPTLGKPVLVMRDVTERPEAVQAGTARLVGASRQSIVSNTLALLKDANAWQAMSRAGNPYGDGQAAARIVQTLLKWREATP
jgi:UDP-N-acetylglucosamine 2-epimerase (non-hydrolysing)